MIRRERHLLGIKLKTHLSDTVDYCIDQINKNENRNAALTSLGLVIYLVSKSGSLIFSEKPLLQKIITCYRHVIEEEGGLSEDPSSAGRRFNPVNPNLFKSLNLIILGIGCNPNVNLHSLKEPNSLWKSNENRYFLNLVMAAGYIKEWIPRTMTTRPSLYPELKITIKWLLMITNNRFMITIINYKTFSGSIIITNH